ncbi:ABC transporter substrate-binding protein [Pollutimonas bauzanensis]|uniref:Polar amino acid transport system substrate-binding protein n=1 Tax=Pollutimonas bauzanensis TaxID=658167 RepID=A0A1M5VB35_9BURK|nr:ABC transporter substrate-binding protein [Pollutimonas bauzanensis]SHH72368.1 polar amino acid transport system substrate-binding protein [Pollutimonas bauzanensis]
MQTELNTVIQDLAPTGALRVAINFGNPVLAQPQPQTQAPMGVSADLAQELARRLGVPLEFITYDGAGKVFAAADADVWDIAFMAIDPLRAEKVMFTRPYVIIEGSYLVPAGSSLRSIGDVDSPGVRIAVGRGAAYDLFLSRSLRHAEILRADTSAAAIGLFLEQSLDAAAGVRQPLAAFAATRDDLRVIDGCFTVIEQAMATPKGRGPGLEYLMSFVDEMKASGFVAQALERSGQHDAGVAP